MTGLDELPGKSHYFRGRDPSQWRTNVPSFAKVKYQDVYPGVDLLYYGRQGKLECDFIVAPGADPKSIQLAFEGADRIELDTRGVLVLQTLGGEIRWNKPRVYQEINGIRKPIAGNYRLDQKPDITASNFPLVGFQVGVYDTALPLVIDPVLEYSTYLGGSSSEGGSDIAVDGEGNAYVTGNTRSPDFPTMDPPQPSFGGVIDLFVAKLNPAGSAPRLLHLPGWQRSRCRERHRLGS